MSKNLVFLSLVMTGLAACGSGSKEMTVAEFTQKISENECASVADACLVEKPVCQSARHAYWSGVAKEAMDAKRPFDPSLADGCLSKVMSVYGVLGNSTVIQAKEYRQMEQTCRRVFHGLAKETQACSVDLDCVDDMVCDRKVCGHLVEVGAGKQCANIGEYCALGFVCAEIGTGPVRQCVARSGKGAPCTASIGSCLENLRCADNVCTERLGVAKDCQDDKDCDSGFCEPFAHKCSNSIRFSDRSACQAFGQTDPVVPPSSSDASVD